MFKLYTTGAGQTGVVGIFLPLGRICVPEVRQMVGQLVWVRAKGRGRAEMVELGGLKALRWTLYVPEGLAIWRLERRLRKAEKALARAGVGRVLLGPDFPWGDRLTLLRPVDSLPMLRACADVLALGALAAEKEPPRLGRVALSAPRLCPELEAASERLCPQVRGLPKSSFICAIRSESIWSAMGQPAAGFARNTVLFGDNIFTVSAINLTPHIITILSFTSAAFWLRPKESPT